jgi:hypothetical protein
MQNDVEQFGRELRAIRAEDIANIQSPPPLAAKMEE